jgi:hypothetical protein
MGEIVTCYESASGSSFDDCTFIGLRMDEAIGYQPEEMECWVVSVRRALSGPHPLELRCQGGTMSWYVGIWRSPAGRVYIADAHGYVHSNPDLWAVDARERWESPHFETTLNGVFGIDDGCVFTWGSTFDKKHSVHRFDGTAWNELPSPSFAVRSMHGLAPDLVYAVGLGGRIARWDGARWTEVASPVSEDLKSVFVAGPDEIYAVGAAGSVLEGSAHGCEVIAQAPLGRVGMALYAVAKWRGELWIGGGPQGLFKRVANTRQLDLIKPNVKAVSLDARQTLVMGTEDWVCGTSDGQTFQAAGANFLREARAGRQLGDLS